MTNTVRARYLNISLHDVSPHCWHLCRSFLEELKSIGGGCTNLLVVPNWYGKYPLDEHPEFLRWLAEMEAEGHEICLHGYTHKVDRVDGSLWNRLIGTYYTASEGEFHQVGYEEAQRLLDRGLPLLRNAGLTVRGFVAPAWLLSRMANRALGEKQFLYTTSLMHFECLPIKSAFYAPSITWSSRSLWRRMVSKQWTRFWYSLNSKTEVLRIVAHPLDLQYHSIKFSIFHTIRKALHDRTPITYADLAYKFIERQNLR